MLGTKLFRYEIAGLKQSDETENLGYQIRTSGNTFITVPYARMNSEMRRITRMGGKIVNIQPLSVGENTGTENADNN